MCLGIPARIVSLDESKFLAEVDIMGNIKQVSVMLTPGVEIGSWVVVHAGQAITVVSDDEARESIAIWEELLQDDPFQ